MSSPTTYWKLTHGFYGVRVIHLLVFCVVLCYVIFIVCLRLVCPMLPVSLDCAFLVATSGFYQRLLNSNSNIQNVRSIRITEICNQCMLMQSLSTSCRDTQCIFFVFLTAGFEPTSLLFRSTESFLIYITYFNDDL